MALNHTPKPPDGFLPNQYDPAVLWKMYCYDVNEPEYMKVFASNTHAVEDIAGRAMIALQMKNATDIDVVVGGEFMILGDQGRWKGGDQGDLDDQAALGLSYPVVRSGYWADAATWARMVEVVFLDQSFPQVDVTLEQLQERGLI